MNLGKGLPTITQEEVSKLEKIWNETSSDTLWKLVPTTDESGFTFDELFGISVRLCQEINSGATTPVCISAFEKLQPIIDLVEPPTDI